MRAKESGQSPLLLLDVIDVLNQEKVPYAIIGAMAVSFYGVVRSSLDADVLIQLNPNADPLRRLRSTFIKAGMNVVVKKGDVHDPLVGVILIEDQYDNHVDLLMGLRKGDPNSFKRVRRIEFQGETICMAGVEDLIAMKIYAGSPKDMADVEGILAVSAGIIDRKKLIRLARHFSEDIANTLKEMIKQGI